MKATPKKIRFIKNWNYYKVGDVIPSTWFRRDWFVEMGYAEYTDEKDVIERACRAGAPEIAATLRKGS